MAIEELVRKICSGKVGSKADLKGADLSGADLSGADLSGADLSGADLSGAILRDVDFKNANLSNALLIQADLSRADLRGSDLSDADLSGADLISLNLGGALLIRADLRMANLTAANLTAANLLDACLYYANFSFCSLGNANFHFARLGETVFSSVDLSKTLNLDSTEFAEPCSVDHRTLELSGPLPHSFLVGCGFSDIFISYMSSIFGSGIEFFSCFISHSSKDKKFARRLYDALQGRGIRCWLDEHDILPGDKIHHEIDTGIKVWDKVLMVCSEASLSGESSWWLDLEIESAFAKERKLRNRKSDPVPNPLVLIPLDLDSYLFTEEFESNHYLQEIKSRNAAKFTGWESDNDLFEEQLERLIKALRSDAGRKPPPPEPKLK